VVKQFVVKITDKIPEIKELLKRAGESNIREATFSTHDVLIDQILVGTRSGRFYNVPGTKKKYQASAPGEAPARRFGDLARDYKPYVKGFVGYIGAMLLYALMLEKGTSGKGGMKPRPHLGIAFEKNKNEIIRILSKEYL